VYARRSEFKIALPASNIKVAVNIARGMSHAIEDKK
jgi:hypothetical protein